ncbi:MAG: hypothetical protein K2L10_01455 [Ruminococcus sp.]|nr:hypothetical protein [Ruminococcus sp.]
MNKEILDKINQFTRRPFTEEEIYTFSVILCDNDIDRDFERFSDTALETLAENFIGKTGIFDHNPTTSNQNARIFDTEIVTDNSRKTKTGEPYKYLKASAYMVRTADNETLISEIDGGIKKEVSISCSASSRKCSICGCDKAINGCVHTKGKMYNNKISYVTLDNITDVYEWSFVAVPAQINAGVTKRSVNSGNISTYSDVNIINADNELRRDIRRLAFFAGGKSAVDNAMISAEFMNTSQLIEMKKSFEKCMMSTKIEVQLIPDKENDFSADDFSMKQEVKNEYRSR